MKLGACDRYLQQATRGLWGKKRLEVREELAAHLKERITAHRIGGLSDSAATQRALAELGAPQHVSRGMTRIHTLPTVMGSSLALLALCLSVMALWPKSIAQTLSGTFYYPTQECLQAVAEENANSHPSECVTINDEFWVDIDALKEILSAQGVVFKIDGFAADMLSISVPGTNTFFIEPYPRESVIGIGALVRGYVPFWNIIERFAQTKNAHLKISGWDNPIIDLNESSFRLKDGLSNSKGEEFYQSYLSAVLDRGLTVNSRWGKYKDSFGLQHDQIINLLKGDLGKSFRTLRFSVGGNRGDVYGVATLIAPESTLAQRLNEDFIDFDGPAFYHLDMTRVELNGMVTIQVPKGPFRLVEDVSFPNVKPGDSVLVRLAGGNSQKGGWYEVVSPESVRLEPR